jgi:predicted negative regulator of RcsB-dependent stress response
MTELDRRLKNVQQADLTESRVNDDFVLWLKTWGQNILLVVLTVAALAMAWHWWGQREEQARDAAWAELGGASTPAALQEVAMRHSGQDAIAALAQLQAAGTYLMSVHSGRRFDRDATAADAAVTPELRAEWLKEADALYASVESAGASATTLGGRAMRLAALFGRAAVAEDRGDLAAAEGFLKAVVDSSKDTPLANSGEAAAARIASLQGLSTPVAFAPKPVAPAPVVPTDPAGVPATQTTGEDIVKQLQGGGQPAPAPTNP